MIIKVLFRTLLRFIRDLDGLLSTLAYKLFKPRYKIGGKCLRRGVCCKNIAIFLSDGFWTYPLLKKMAIWWYCFVYNFSYVGEEPEHKIIGFRCNYLKDNLCSIHWRRPFICRNYPLLRYFDKPVFLPGCGYRILDSTKDSGPSQKS